MRNGPASPGDIIYTHSFTTPVGRLHAAVDRAGRVLGLAFTEIVPRDPRVRVEPNKYACGELELQVEQYFAGERTSFSLEVRTEGTSFQKSVWSRLMKIRFGDTITYGEVARKIGRRGAARAVGNAVSGNPAVLIIPCHRVIPASGGTGNYAPRGVDPADGKRIKSLLLELETGQRILTS